MRKYGFGRLIDLARPDPVAVASMDASSSMLMALEEFERLKALEEVTQSPKKKGKG